MQVYAPLLNASNNPILLHGQQGLTQQICDEIRELHMQCKLPRTHLQREIMVTTNLWKTRQNQLQEL